MSGSGRCIALLIAIGLCGTASVFGRSMIGQTPSAAAQLEDRLAKASALQERATAVTVRIGELAASGKLPASDEALALMKKMVEELQEIREQLQKIAQDVDGFKRSVPALEKNVQDMRRVRPSAYAQFQWSDTQEGPNSSSGSNRTNSDGFALRRLRLGATYSLDPKTSMKLTFDVAAGSQRTSAELRDAILNYDLEAPGSSRLSLGQQPLPLGYEIERSSSEREFPERSLYNRTMFAGERGRGVLYRRELSDGLAAHIGVWNSLSVSDPQQNDANSFRNLNGGRVAGTAGIRYSKDNLELGVSAFVGERPGTSARTITTWRDLNGNGVPDPGEVTTVNIPATSEVDRKFLYADAKVDVTQKLTLRAEWMRGQDRVPTLNSNGTPVSTGRNDVEGWHAAAVYRLDPKNQFALRHEFFDPDTGTDDDVRATALALIHQLNPGAKLTLAHEWVDEQGFERKNNVWTLRVQFKL